MPSHEAINLRLGALAIEQGLICREEWCAAVDAWAADKSKSIISALAARGTVDEATIERLKSLAAEALLSAGDGAALPSDAAPTVDWPAKSPAQGVADLLAKTVGHAYSTPDFADLDTMPPASERSAQKSDLSRAGSRYRVVRPHARGGLGQVFVARDQELNRDVALKEIQERFAGDEGNRARFLREAEITGSLEHPGIVPIYGLGSYADGRPYYAMRFVHGDSLQNAIAAYHRQEDKLPGHAARRRLAFRELMGRLIAVCHAIDYAHQQGVLHRDLKPDNIMLGKHGETLVVDWGLAKVMRAVEPEAQIAVVADAPDEGQSSRDSSQTRLGDVIGTPAFMSPEQAAGRLDATCPESDVYGLGATLYCILTGQSAFVDAKSRDVHATLESVIRGDFPPPRRIARHVPRALERVCLKAMALDSKDRYRTASALADDLEHWLADEPVTALPESVFVGIGRWCRRHRGASAAAVLAGVTLCVASVIVYELRQENDRQRVLSELTSRQLESETKAREAEAYYAITNRVRARNTNRPLGWTWRGVEDIVAAGKLAYANRDPVELRSLAIDCLAATDLRPAGVVKHAFPCEVLSFSPDGKQFAVGRHLSNGLLYIEVIDWESRQRVNTVRLLADPSFMLANKSPDGIASLAFSPDSAWLAAGTRSGWIYVWDVNDSAKQPQKWKAHQGGGKWIGIAWQGGSDALYSVAAANEKDESSLKLWHISHPSATVKPTPGVLRAERAMGSLHGLTVASDGSSLIVAGEHLHFLDPNTLATVSRRNLETVRSEEVCLSPDNRLLASDELAIYGMETGALIRRFVDPEVGAAHDGFLDQLKFDATGSLLVSCAGGDRMVKIWDVASGALLAKLLVAGAAKPDAQFHPSGRFLTVLTDDKTTLYEVGGRTIGSVAAGQADFVRAVDFAATSDEIACKSERPEVHNTVVTRWNAKTNQRLSQWPLADRCDFNAHSVAYSPDDQWLIVSSEIQSNLWLWNIVQPDAPQKISLNSAHSPSFSADGQRILACGADDQELLLGKRPGVLVAFEAATLSRTAKWSSIVAELKDGHSRLSSLAAASSSVAVGSSDGVRLFSQQDGKLEFVRALSSADNDVECVAMNDRGTLVAHGTSSGAARIDRVADGSTFARLTRQENAIDAIAFSPDGQFLATGSRDRIVALWKVTPNGVQPLWACSGFTKGIRQLRFNHDGSLLAVLVRDESAVRILHIDALREHLGTIGLDWQRD